MAGNDTTRFAGHFEWWLTGLMACVGLVLSALAFVYVRDIGREDELAAAERRVASYTFSLRAEVERHVMFMRALRGVLGAPLSRRQFSLFVSQVKPSMPSLRAAAWMPRVSMAERESWERLARAEGLPNFTIKGARGEEPGDEAFPVFFFTPQTRNDDIFGVDVLSLPDRRRTLEVARDTGNVVVTERLRLLQDPSGPYSVVFYAAVYESGSGPATVADRRAAIRGAVAASFDFRKLMAAAFGDGLPESDLYVLDESAPMAERLLYFASAGGANASPLSAAELAGVPHLRRTLEVGGRSWAVVMPLGSGNVAGDSVTAFGVLGVGVLLTGLLTILYAVTVTRARRTEMLAAALGHSNETLRSQIAERRQVEAALTQAEARLRLALRSAPVSLFTQDRELRYTWLFKSRVGLSQEEAEGKTDADLFPPKDAAVLEAIKRQVLTSGVGLRQEVEVHRRGRRAMLDLCIEPQFDETGRICGIIGTAIDVTAERSHQFALDRARAEAERANEAKSRFLAAASHDLRQPLQATRLFLEALLVRLKEPDHRNIAEKAIGALEATDGLLNALLDVSTLEAGIVRPEFTEVPVSRLFARLAGEFSHQAEVKGLRFRTVDCSLAIYSDPILLQRMLRNLLVNALRYTEKGGILLGCRRDGNSVRIDVCDTGPGIPADKQEAIFDDFIQLGNPERDRNRGLGLGLSVVRRMARLLGHPVRVRSRIGHGSVFSVSVPLAGRGAQAGRRLESVATH